MYIVTCHKLTQHGDILSLQKHDKKSIQVRANNTEGIGRVMCYYREAGRKGRWVTFHTVRK